MARTESGSRHRARRRRGPALRRRPSSSRELDGRPLLEHAVARDARGAGDSPSSSCSARDADEVRADVDLGGARRRRLRGLGARASRPRCARAWPRSASVEAVVVTLGDQPFITPQVIAGVLDHRGPARRGARDLRRRARPPGRCSAAACSTRVAELAGDAGARDAARAAARVRLRGRPAGRPDRHRHARTAQEVPLMKLEQSFDVAAPIEQVWQALIDVERVAPVPARRRRSPSHDEDGTYQGTFAGQARPDDRVLQRHDQDRERRRGAPTRRR